MHGEDIEGNKCKGLRGIIDEGEDLIKHDDNLDVRDAAIIAAAQKVEHYEMAGLWHRPHMGGTDGARKRPHSYCRRRSMRKVRPIRS